MLRIVVFNKAKPTRSFRNIIKTHNNTFYRTNNTESLKDLSLSCEEGKIANVNCARVLQRFQLVLKIAVIFSIPTN